MTPATREGAFDLVAEIIDRGLRRRDEHARKSAKARRQRKAVDAANADPDSRRSPKSESTSDAKAS
jgi:hypothetical protein